MKRVRHAGPFSICAARSSASGAARRLALGTLRLFLDLLQLFDVAARHVAGIACFDLRHRVRALFHLATVGIRLAPLATVPVHFVAVAMRRLAFAFGFAGALLAFVVHLLAPEKR